MNPTTVYHCVYFDADPDFKLVSIANVKKQMHFLASELISIFVK